MAIKCCNGCVAPKRYPGCHDHCPEYREEKAKEDALKEADYKRRKLVHELNEQRYAAITKATKNKINRKNKA